jgi:actin-like ATPase involved in cell morphogenesis
MTLRVVGIDLGTTTARVAWPEAETTRVFSLSAAASSSGGPPMPSAPDLDALFGAELTRLEHAGPVSAVVLAVPVDADPIERLRLRQTARRHGFDAVRLLSSPVAAAVASARAGDLAGRVLVLDLGDRGLAASAVMVAPGRLDVVSAGLCPVAGGERLDEIAAAALVELAGPDAAPSLAQAAHREARAARHALTEHFEVRVTLDAPGAGRRVVKLSRDQFEQRARPALMQAEATIRHVLGEAHWRPEDLDTVLLVGGGAYMPLARRFATEVTGRRVRVPELPETWAAVGAAAYAQSLWGEGPVLCVTEILPVAVRVPGLDGAPELLLPRGCPLPASATCCRPADLPLRLEGAPGDVAPEASFGGAPVYAVASVEAGAAAGGSAGWAAPVTWTIEADEDAVLTVHPDAAHVVSRPETGGGLPVPPEPPVAATRRLPLVARRFEVLERTYAGLTEVGVPTPTALFDEGRAALATGPAGVPAALAVLDRLDALLEAHARAH